jgi:DNA-binding NtrC family response regulator
LRAMAAYAWPGNIRELLNAVHKAILLSTSPLIEVDLGTGQTPQGEPEFLGFDEATSQFQKRYLHEALALVEGNREQAAKVLKMSRSTFFRYLAQLGVE